MASSNDHVERMETSEASSLNNNEDDATSIEKKIKIALENTEVGGSVATSKVADYLPSIPELYIKDYGIVPLPVNETVVQGIRSYFKPAPYGMGEKTVFDESVRQSWQMDPEKFEIQNKEFLSIINEKVVSEVKEGLGCRNSAVHVEIYKLLLYEPGGHFKPHRDTEKAKGMFGTLIVQLPSLFTGGDLILSHNGKKEVIKFSHQQSVSKCMYAAHYADVEHEITKVKSGYRLALIFSLCWNGNGIITSSKQFSTQTQILTELLKDWRKLSPPGKKLTWAMEHMYSLESLKFKGITALKGKDKMIAENLHNTISEMSDEERFVLYIAKYTKFEEMSGQCTHDPEYYGWGGGMGRVYYNPRHEDCFEEIEVFESGIRLEEFISANGNLVNSKISCSNGENILNKNDLSDDEWWGDRISGECSGPSGNEGATKTYWYHKYVLIVWRDSDFLQIFGSDSSAAIKYLECSLDGVVNDPIKLRCICDQTFQLLQKLSAEKTSFSYGENLIPLLQRLHDIRLVKLFLSLQSKKEPVFGYYTKARPDDLILMFLKNVFQKYSWSNLAKEAGAFILSQPPRQIEYFLNLVPSEVPVKKFVAQLGKIYIEGKKTIPDEDLKAISLFMFQNPDICYKFLNILSEMSNLDSITVLSNLMVHLNSHDPGSIKTSPYFKQLENKFINLAEKKSASKELNSLENVKAVKVVYSILLEIKSVDNILLLNEAIMKQRPNNRLLFKLLEKYVQSVPSLVHPLHQERVAQLESIIKGGIPKFSWEQPNAVIRGHPEVQKFLRSTQETYRYANFTSLNHARRWVSKHFSDHHPFGDEEFSAKAQAGGRGKGAFVVIEKTKKFHEKQTREHHERIGEYKRLKSLPVED